MTSYFNVEWQRDPSDPESGLYISKTNAIMVEKLLTQLFGCSYDLTVLKYDADAIEDIYYDDGQLICYAAWLQYSERAQYQRTEDVPFYSEYKEVVFTIEGDEFVDGSITLSLRMVNNDLGYMITDFTCSRY